MGTDKKKNKPPTKAYNLNKSQRTRKMGSQHDRIHNSHSTPAKHYRKDCSTPPTKAERGDLYLHKAVMVSLLLTCWDGVREGQAGSWDLHVHQEVTKLTPSIPQFSVETM